MQKTPDQVTSAEVMGFCFGKGLSGREAAAITIGSRIATISSFYRFLIRMQMLSSNPCDALERPKHNPAPARGLSAEDVKKLAVIRTRSPNGGTERSC
jgi:site-specific recombinase XerD